ncbi:MAG: hypothetical protein ACK4TA_16070 [Saprospiraceae bacterium]
MADHMEMMQALIARDFELESPDQVLSEADLLRLLAEQVAYMIDYKLEVLLSLMYRLDIDENKVSAALSPLAPEPANVGIARLVLERQKQRAFTKQYYKQDSNWNWEED